MDLFSAGRHDLLMTSSAKFSGAGASAVSRIEKAIDRHLSKGPSIEAWETLKATVAAETVTRLEETLRASLSYRDVLLIQLAWGLENDGFDHTRPPVGARPASRRLTSLLHARHIAARKEVYQTLAKGNRSGTLLAGNVPSYDALLLWLNEAGSEEREALFELLTMRMALDARPVQAMPTLARANLTFVAVARFLNDLLGSGSGGVFEQFAVAAVLSALIDEFGLGGQGSLRVETKNINASDASAGTAADVQIMRGGRVEEAFEVSASDWKPKVTQAVTAARNAELPRAHVLAYGGDLEVLEELLGESTTDVTVIDVRDLLRVIVAILKKPAREDALRKLYDLIDQKQTDVELVNRYVDLLRSHALTA